MLEQGVLREVAVLVLGVGFGMLLGHLLVRLVSGVEAAIRRP